MSWKSIDFQGIISLESPLIESLSQYLEEKESYLAYTLVTLIPLSFRETPFLPPVRHPSFKLPDAIEMYTKCRFHKEGKKPDSCLLEWKKGVEAINKLLWDYTDAIDSCITELFQQVDQVGLEKWHMRLSHVIGSVREILIHKIEDLIWAIRRLEDLLLKMRLSCADQNLLQLTWIKMNFLWKSSLDSSLVPHLQKDQENLKTLYNKFIHRYEGFLQLQEKVEPYLNRLGDYEVLSELDPDIQIHFVKLYQLLKLWDLNRKEKALPSREFILAIRNAASVDRAIFLFKEYTLSLRQALFEKSIQIKKSDDSKEEGDFSENLIDELKGMQAEVHLLGSTVAHYREFLLRADPDPYVRSRLGFSDWIVGPEPIQTKPLLNLGYDIETLDELYQKMIHSLTKKDQSKVDHSLLDQEIQDILHEMSHPLASHRLMRRESEKILNKLEQLDELSSRDANITEYFSQLLARLMRVDWRYHVLFGFPSFHQMYSIHRELTKPANDRHHSIRLQKFQKLIQRILGWVKAQKTQEHAHEIEFDMSDIQGYLQDFLGYIQRNINDLNMTRERAFAFRKEMLNELLEYRYLFGNFFYRLRQNESDGPLIRRQFLFVDQYFETIELKLNEITDREWPEENQSPNESKDESEDF